MTTQYDPILELVKIQYPTDDPQSLQRSITQIKELLEDPKFYETQKAVFMLALLDLTRRVEELESGP